MEPEGPLATKKPLPFRARSSGLPVGAIEPCPKSVHWCSMTGRTVGVVPSGESLASADTYMPKNSRSALNPGDEALAMLLANISRLSILARIPLAAALVRGSIRLLVVVREGAIHWPERKCFQTHARTADEYVVERVCAARMCHNGIRANFVSAGTEVSLGRAKQ